MKIRKSETKDVEQLLDIYAAARRFMEENGNAAQWVDGYPQKSQIEQDIAQGHSYVCCKGDDILAVFYFAVEAEPNYTKIYNGHWQNAASYGVVHRIAVAERQKGVASYCLDWCFNQHGNVRIDTHKDNISMQKLVQKHGYIYCGMIHLANGDERLAYQKTVASNALLHKGSCLCGVVQFEIKGPFESFYYCHCSRCRKVTGSAHAANLFSYQATLNWISGQDSIKVYHLKNTRFTPSFCMHCGSALPIYNEKTKRLKVPAGSLDSELTMAPTHRIFLDSKALWDRG